MRRLVLSLTMVRRVMRVMSTRPFLVLLCVRPVCCYYPVICPSGLDNGVVSCLAVNYLSFVCGLQHLML
jgi:hypothetical protein